MSATFLEPKQKFVSNYDQSIFEPIDDVLTRDNLHLSESKNRENFPFSFCS
jgi:NADPH-dependent 7-cyano-7-deazaguanine reductase QueF-like protein